jgi:hypothetical protein
MAPSVEALEPKLLWEKKFEYKHLSLGVAEISGDVIVSSKDAREVILYDKDGNEIAHWGPRIDRLPFGASISADGKYFAFHSMLTEEYANKKRISKYSDDRIHLFDRKGKELWNEINGGYPIISQDGTYIVVVYDGMFDIRDMNGKELFEYKEKGSGGVTEMSSDSLFFAITGYLPGAHFGYKMTLFSKDGTKIWAKNYHSQPTSITDGASFIATTPYVDVMQPENSSKGFIYDKNGDVVLEGYAFLSGNGERAALIEENGTKILSLPDKAVLKEFPIKAQSARFSHDGRYLVLYGEKTDAVSGSNIFVFDLLSAEEWETKGEVKIYNFGDFVGVAMRLTKDGKYLITRSKDQKISYYQLY